MRKYESVEQITVGTPAIRMFVVAMYCFEDNDYFNEVFPVVAIRSFVCEGELVDEIIYLDDEDQLVAFPSESDCCVQGIAACPWPYSEKRDSRKIVSVGKQLAQRIKMILEEKAKEKSAKPVKKK